jgi:ATP-grasp domain
MNRVLTKAGAAPASRPAGPSVRSSPAVEPLLILTVGLTADDAYWLERIDQPERFRFRPVGLFAEADDPEICRPRAFVAAALSEARTLLERPAGIVGFDDYPASLLALAIGEQLGLPGPSLQSALRCNHKLWSRLIQRQSAPEAVPRFQVIDPHRDWRPQDLELAFPFWLKPVKSSMSFLSFRIGGFADFERALAAARSGLPAYTAAFDALIELSGLTPPDGAGPEVAAARGDWLIAEELMGGRQCTLDGYMQAGELTVVGIVDSIRLSNRVSFTRFDYPSRLSVAAQRRMAAIAAAVLRQAGFDNGMFNIEFFVDGRGRPKIIEINPRFSPQFSDLFAKVDGRLSHQYVVELAAGLTPAFARRQGRHNRAASCVLRVAEDRLVARAPGPQDIARLQESIPDAHVYLTAKPGDRLSALVQDAYTYRYGLIHLGARNAADRQAKLRRALELLPYELKPVGGKRG